MSDWQPIETAPMDGTAVILYSPDAVKNGFGKGRYIASFQHADPDGKSAPLKLEWRVVLKDNTVSAEQVGGPTHWMPLPEPPTIGGKSGNDPSHNGKKV